MTPEVSRHDFIHSLVRQGVLAGLLGVGIAALHGKKSVSECFNHNYCSSCWAYTGCSLPEKKEISHE